MSYCVLPYKIYWKNSSTPSTKSSSNMFGNSLIIKLQRINPLERNNMQLISSKELGKWIQHNFRWFGQYVETVKRDSI